MTIAVLVLAVLTAIVVLAARDKPRATGISQDVRDLTRRDRTVHQRRQRIPTVRA